MKQKITATGCADRLRAMADPDRLRIVTALHSGTKTVGELNDSRPPRGVRPGGNSSRPLKR